MNKPLSIAPAIMGLVFWGAMPVHGQSALNSFDPNANRGVGNGSQRTESVRNSLIAGPTATPSPPAQLISLSTRLRVQSGRFSTGGFFVTGGPKNVIVRVIGPSLTAFGVADALADPRLELQGPAGFTTIVNNNWRDTQQAAIEATGLSPSNDLESAIVATLNPGSYVAIAQGNGNTEGVALIEVYDLNQSAGSKLSNLSTLAFVSINDNIVIAGFLLGNNSGADSVILRGRGPSLAAAGVPNVLANPVIELRDNNGALIFSNNDWQDNPAQAALITAAGLGLSNSLEAAIAATLSPGLYTVLFAGLNNTTGNGLLEVYDLRASGGTPVPSPTPTPPGGTPSPTPTPPPPVITSPLAVTVTVGQLFVYKFEAAGATSLAVSSPPPGLTFNTSLRSIVGNPTTPGTFSTGLSAMNAGGTTNATLTITVQPLPSSGPAIMSSTAAGGRTNRPFSFRVATTGGSLAARLAASGLPSGLTADSVTGQITGIPTSDGSFAVTLTVTDGSFITTSTLQLTFTSDPAVPVIVSPNSATLTPGQFFSYTIVTDAPDSTSFAYVGTLPPGLMFDAVTGTISGIPTDPLRASSNGGPREPDQTGGIIRRIQLFGTNLQGSFNFQFYFSDPLVGVVNIATRAIAGTGGDVLIGAFVIDGNAPKVVLVRAIGPSLTNLGVPNALADPTLRLQNNAPPNQFHDNDNWDENAIQKQFIEETMLKPREHLESAILIALDPGSYSAIVAGKNSTTGAAVVDVFDLGTASLSTSSSPLPQAKLANISTRALVGLGDNVLFGGFSVQNPGPSVNVVVRAIGPSLTPFGVPNALADPTLELYRNGSSMPIASNNNWMSWAGNPISTNFRPTNSLESAMALTLAPGQYTAIVRGVDATTGVAVVDVYVE